MNFESLVGRINQVQDVLQAQAAHAVNLSLTARNWLASGNSIWQSATAKLQSADNQYIEKWRMASAKSTDNTALVEQIAVDNRIIYWRTSRKRSSGN